MDDSTIFMYETYQTQLKKVNEYNRKVALSNIINDEQLPFMEQPKKFLYTFNIANYGSIYGMPIKHYNNESNICMEIDMDLFTKNRSVVIDNIINDTHKVAIDGKL